MTVVFEEVPESPINVKKRMAATFDERMPKRTEATGGELDFGGYDEYNLIGSSVK